MVTKFEGTFKRIYRRDNESGSTVFGVTTDEIAVARNRFGEVECEGVIPNWPEDTFLYLTGNWNEDNTVFLVRSAKPLTQTEEISKQLLKGVLTDLKAEDPKFKVGQSVIKKILAVSGPDVLSFIKHADSFDRLLADVKIDREKLEKIYKSLVSVNESGSVVEYVMKFGGTIASCSRLIGIYGPNALQELKKRPFPVGYEAGLSFLSRDRIAKSLNIKPISKDRVEAMIYEALDYLLESTGSTYATASDLKRQVAKVAANSAYPDDIIPPAYIAVRLGKMQNIKQEEVTNGFRIYKRKYYQAECKIACELRRLNEKKEQIEKEKFDKVVKERETSGRFSVLLSEEQKSTFDMLRASGVKILTGGPGVGKTTTIREILALYRLLYPKGKIALAAPTGRAAKRMTEITGMEAQTIHRLLEFKPYQGRMDAVYKDSSDPIDADLVIVDEMSMVDTELFSLLLPAIKTGSILLCVGDENQLQSVSPGNILRDLIKSGEFDLYRLTRVYRQKGDNPIVENAYGILEGSMKFKKEKQFNLYQTEDDKDAAAKALELYEELRKETEPSQIQILTPTKRETCGTVRLNSIISEQANKESGGKCFRYGRNCYRVGDRVIFNKNDYDAGFFNGDIGYIDEITKNGLELKIDSDIKPVTGATLQALSLAYAITIHKSQGSEFEHVIIVLPEQFQSMLTRNLLFTAVTRARTTVSIVYVKSSLYDAVSTVMMDKRKTGLAERIRKIGKANKFKL